MRRWMAVLVAALLTLAALGIPARAATTPEGRITSIDVTEGEITLAFTGTNLPAGTSIDPESVAVSLDGEPAEATAAAISEAADVPTRIVMLVMDASSSMGRQGKMDAAKQAATSFLEQLPDDVLAGVVRFKAKPKVIAEPTTDRAVAIEAIEAMEARGDSALYDGVLLGVAATGDEDVRSVLVLSDGQDNGSAATLPGTVEAVGRSGVQVDAISLGVNDEDALSALTQITAASGGSVVQADNADDLASIYAGAATAISNELLVTATVPEDFTAVDATLQVEADAGETPLTASAFVTLQSGITEARPAPVDYGPIAVAPPPAGLPRWAYLVGLVAVAIGLSAVLFSAFGGGKRPEAETVRGRLSIYSLTGHRPRREREEVTTTALGGSAAARSAVELADRVVKKREYEDDLSNRLDAAGLPLRVAEWVLIHVGLTVGGGVLMLLIFGFNFFAGLVGIALGLLIPFAYLANKARRRRDKFEDQLPDTLQLMSGSMSAGYSLPQSVDTIVREDIDPVSSEFNRALIESRLGIPMEDALEQVAERMQSQDFLWVVMAIRIQRQVGGNLAELLTTVANTLRERAELRRQVRVLSAEGRLSAWILTGLPIFVFAVLLVINPGYLSPLVTDVLGWVMLGIAAILFAIGIFWMSRVVKVEV